MEIGNWKLEIGKCTFLHLYKTTIVRKNEMIIILTIGVNKLKSATKALRHKERYYKYVGL